MRQRDNDIRSAMEAFQQQRRNARKRGISWDLTFDQWWSIWQASDHWNARGCGGQHYCMARIGDAGAYAVGNVYICTNPENSKDYHKAHGERRSVTLRRKYLAKSLLFPKWKLDVRRNSKPHHVTLGRRYIGVFATPEAAERAHRSAVLAELASIGER